LFFSHVYGPHRHLPSFPTRRSSDLAGITSLGSSPRVLSTRAVKYMPGRSIPFSFSTFSRTRVVRVLLLVTGSIQETSPLNRWPGDRKSTRLNSSHVKISYAVFCLKK